MRNLDVESSAQDQANVAERVFTQIKQGQSCNDNMYGITHTFKIMFSKKLRHGRACNGSGFVYKERVVTLFVAAAIVAVMLIVVVQETSFSANWAGRIFPPTICPLSPGAFGCKLMIALTAEIFLISIFISTVTIK
jgi:hypothetical protein